MMAVPAHASVVGALLALAFTGSLIAILWMLKVHWTLTNAVGLSQVVGRTRVILVPVTVSGDSRRRVEAASRLALEQHASLLLVCVVEVPWTMPLNADLGQADQDAQAALNSAHEIAAELHLPIRMVIRRARVVRDGIAETARDHHADLIFTDRDVWARRRHPAHPRSAAR